MNAHIPQSISATSEAEILMRSAVHIVSAQRSSPVNGLVQDGLVGPYLLTNRWEGSEPDTMVSVKIFENCIEGAEIPKNRYEDLLFRAREYYPSYIKKDKNGNYSIKTKEIPGKLMFSILFPPNLFYEKGNDKDAESVKIRDGVILPNSGPITKKIVGAEANSVIHVLWKEYSPETALYFLSETQQLIDRWLPTHGFSMGISDCMSSSSEDVARILTELNAKIGVILGKAVDGIPNKQEEMEISVLLHASLTSNSNVSLIYKNMAKGDRNALKIMQFSGAKGKNINLMQISAFVGQQSISGGFDRIPATLSGGSRTLPIFEANDYSPEARGFVERNYLNGLNPQEVFFHSAGGRVGIIATAIKSVTRDTPIIVIERGESKRVLIGDWVDNLMGKYPKYVKFYPEDNNLEVLNVENVQIPTTDEKGNTSWGKLTAVTRHDPSKRIYKITTESGRKVTVAESNSLLIWDKECKSFLPKNSPDVKIGDFVPVTAKLPEPPIIKDFIDMKDTRFELNRENGFFVGLFIADGDCRLDGNYVRITKNDEVMQQCIINWFEKHSIRYDKYTRTGETGSSDSIRGHSVMWSQFFAIMCGQGAKNKHVPPESFTAPLDFVGGLLDGYFSGDGCVPKNKTSIIVSSASKRLIDEISVLLLRFGIFGKMSVSQLKSNYLGTVDIAPSYRLAINKLWAKELEEVIGLTHPEKKRRLRNIGEIRKSSKYEMQKDCVKDKIKTIDILQPKEKSLYDVSVEGTLNFMTSEGLQIRDTASTGYIQKRIGRKIEDFQVEIDGSVRDANKRIIQFLYGDDGMDPKKLCYPKGIEFPFFINLVNLAQRLNSDAKRQEQINEGEEPRSLEDDEIEYFMTFIHAGPPKLKTKNIKHATNNTREILRKLLKAEGVKLYESVIPVFVAEIRNTYEKSKCQYGDMVGLDAASCIGEPTTQLSTVRGTRIVFREETGKNAANEIKYGTIGEIVDEYLEKHEDKIIHLGNDSVVWHPSQNIFIMTVNTENEKTEWKKISEFSRHPTNGDLVKVRTKSKREVTTTLAHSHLSRTKMGKIVPKKAGELKKGDFIPVSKKMNSEILYKSILIPKKGGDKDNFPLDFDNGWLIGAYLAEGNIVNKTQLQITNISEHFEKRVKFFSERYGGKMKTINRLGKIMPNNPEYEKYPEYHAKEYIVNHIPHIVKFILTYCGTGSGSKKVPGFALFAPLEFVSGILRGYFDGDGNVNPERQLIRVHSISQSLLEQIALLLSRFGIFGTFGVEKKHRENPLHNYIILRKHARLFMENIGSDFSEKLSAIKEIVDYNERDDVHSRREDIDRIPEMGEEIARVALPLNLSGYSRNYGRWTRGKSAIGRETLKNYREIFNQKAEEKGLDVDLSLIDQAINSDIIWDEITDIEIIQDPKEMVYDFGVEGNHTFMIQNGIFTHNTLNVFHLAGLGGKEENLGVPRFEEILNATKSDKQKFPSCSVYFNNEFLNENSETITRLQKKMKEVSDNPIELKILEELEDQTKKDSINYLNPIKKYFEETTVGTFFLDYEMQYLPQDVDPDVGGSPVGIITYKEYEKKWWVSLKEELSGPPSFEPEHWVLIIKFDTEEMFKRDIDLDTICETIQEQSEGKYACVTSPNVLGTIEVYCNFSVIKEYITPKIDLPPQTEDEDIQEELLTPDNVLFFTVREAVLKYIKDVKISGIEGVTKVYAIEDKKTHSFYFDVNCRSIASRPSKKRFINILTADHVDPYKTLTNDMHAIYEVLGIEAARKFLITEVTKIITDRGASFINPRHIQLLVDSMTHTGEITSVRRDGISRDVGPIAKIMFEQAVDNASQAAVFGEPDMMKSVSSSIMYGMTARAGTGVVNIKKSDKMPVQPIRPILVEESESEEETETASESEEETETASDFESDEDEGNEPEEKE